MFQSQGKDQQEDLKKRWIDSVKQDLKTFNLKPTDCLERMAWTKGSYLNAGICQAIKIYHCLRTFWMFNHAKKRKRTNNALVNRCNSIKQLNLTVFFKQKNSETRETTKKHLYQFDNKKELISSGVQQFELAGRTDWST